MTFEQRCKSSKMMDYKYLKKESPKKRASSAKTSDRNTCYVFESQCGGQCVWRGVIKELNDLRGQREMSDTLMERPSENFVILFSV